MSKKLPAFWIEEPAIGQTENSRVYRAWLQLPGGMERACALKVVRASAPDRAAREEAARFEYDRLRRLWEPRERLVPEPLWLGLWEQRSALLLEWVEGVSLEHRLTSPAIELNSPAAVAGLLTRLVRLLHLVHRDLGATCNDLKENSVILTGIGARVIDWNRLGPPSEAGERADLARAVCFATALIKGARVRRIDEVPGVVAEWTQGEPPQRMAAALLVDALKWLEADQPHEHLLVRASNAAAWCNRWRRCPDAREALRARQDEVLSGTPLVLAPLEPPLVPPPPDSLLEALERYRALLSPQRPNPRQVRP
jgi:hypothetical protein